jgi:hypothetical protein
MKTVREVLLCGLIAALIVLVISTVRAVDAVPAELRTARAALIGEASATRQELYAQVGDIAERSERQIAALRVDTLAEVDRIRGTADTHLGNIERIADSRLQETTGTLAGIREDISPTLNNAAALTASAAHVAASDDIPGVIRDTRFLMARAARTAGHIEQAADAVEGSAKEFRGALPRTLAGWDRIVANSDETTKQTANFMGNLAEMTKPLPTWARIGLAVAPPAVQTGFTVGSWLALKGKTK